MSKVASAKSERKQDRDPFATFGREQGGWERSLAIAGCTGDNVVRLRPSNTTPALEAAMGYAIFREWKVFPARMQDGGKWSWLSAEYAPGGEAWGMTLDPEILQRNFTNRKWRLLCGVGVPTGAVNRIFVLEADTLEGHDVDGVGNLKALEKKHGKLPDTLMGMSPSGSPHYYFQHPGRGFKVKLGKLDGVEGVDVKGDGGMVVAPPSVAPESMRCPGPYVWLNNLPIADAPKWLLDLVCVKSNGSGKPSNNVGEKDSFAQFGDEERGKIPLDKLTFMLMKVIPNTEEKGRAHWIKVGHALKYERPGDDGLQVFLQYSKKWNGVLDQKYVVDPQLYEKEITKTWRGLNPNHITGGSLYWLANDADPDWEDKWEAERMATELAEAKQDKKTDSSKTPKKLPWIVELGSKVWGPATAIGKEYRFGEDLTKVIDPGKGMWFDFAINKGGGLKDLMKKVEVAGRAEQTGDVILVNAADVVPRPHDWLWYGHLVRGSQEIFSGVPDGGKTTVQSNLVACVTGRKPWPDGAPAIEPMNVIMMTAEDTLADTVIPRLMAAGADLDRVKILTGIKTDERNGRQFMLSEDLHRLEHEINKIGNVGLVTIDPITAYMGGSMDSYKATEVRSQLGPLKDLAERTHIALSTITHPAKNAGPNALNHFIGSQGFIAASRVGTLALEEMEADDDGGKPTPTGRMLYIVVRRAYTGPIPTLVYRKEVIVVGQFGESFAMKDVTASRIVWEGTKNISGNAALAAMSSSKKPDEEQIKVQAFLCEMLKDGKEVPAKDIEAAAKAEGFSEKQLRTAREKLTIQTIKEPGKMVGGHMWKLSKRGPIRIR